LKKLLVLAGNSPYFLAGFTILLWSFGTYLGRLISLRSQFLLVFFSFLFAAGTLGLYFLWQVSRSKGKYSISFHWRYLVLGSLGYFAYTVPQIQSFRAFGSASETTILTYTWPVFAVLFTGLFRNGKDRRKVPRLANFLEVGALLCGLLSVVLVATQGKVMNMKVDNPLGLFWGMVTGISYGLFSAYSATVPRERQAAFLLSAILTSSVLIAPLAFSEWQQAGQVTLANIGLSAVMGCLLSGVAYITWTAALSRSAEKNMNISKVLSLIYILPLFSLIVIALLLGEGDLAQPYFLVSALLIVVSSILSQRSAQIAGAITRSLHGNPKLDLFR
jgi:drug/metabolite transporter (DMT)-like permease